MGKASKWLRNLLTGKKEDKDKKKDASFSSEDFVLPTASFTETSNQKRRWSFGKSIASTDSNNRKTCRSLDAIASKKLVPRDVLECWNQKNEGAENSVTSFVEAKYGNEQKVTTAIPVPHNEGRHRQTVVPTPFAVTRALKDAAATKIQAFFRGHLARTALKALRGLVKIQALVRGHLVRKQTSEMLRCMNVLMSIQVRARFQRTQMTDEPHIIVKSKLPNREPTHDQLRRGDSELLNLSKTTASWRRNKDLITHQQMKARELDFRTNYSGKITVSKQEHQFLQYQSPLVDTFSRQLEAFSYGTPDRTPQQNYSVSNFNHLKLPQSPSVDYSDTTSHNSQFVHNYMVNTQSSTAKLKLRSHSEPKQRPFKQMTKRSPSFRGIDSTLDNKKQNQSSNRKKSQQPWLIKIYRTAKSSKDVRCESSSIGTSS